MQNVRRILKLLLAASLVLFGFFSFHKHALPDLQEILEDVTQQEPLQEALPGQESITRMIGEYVYRLEPRYQYDLYGLVVSLYDADNLLDFTHKNDPGNMKDICVVWGDNIKSGAYKKVKFSSGEFTCFGRWESNFSPPFSGQAGSNNHLIPSDAHVARLIKGVAIGDQVRVRGYLADYSVKTRNGKILYTRNTSITRDDKGNGACEIVYVNDIEILKKASRLPRDARRVSFWVGLASLALLIWATLVTPLKNGKPDIPSV